MKTWLKYIFLAWFGGSFYVSLEVFYRARSHWSMFALAAALFIMIGLLNEIWSWDTGLVHQVLIGTVLATTAELFVGYFVNIRWGLGIWDYSHLPGNFMGQICPQYIALWIPIVLLAIVMDDVLRWQFFEEEKPQYSFFHAGRKMGCF